LRRGLLIALLAALLTACGSSGGSQRLRPATLVLDFTPNAVHAGIYAALAHKYDRAAGVRLHVVAPTASTDSVKLLETGRASFAILDIHDLAIARARGADLVGIMAIVERPLAALIAAPRFPTPTTLSGRPVGVTGLPSDTAVLDSIVQGAGGNPRKLKPVTIGFDAVPDLLTRRVDAATAFWNDEGVTIQRRSPGFHVFRVDAYGAPAYPELVLCTSGRLLNRQPALARGLVHALVQGYRFTLAHPARTASELESQVQGLDPALVTAELRGLLPAFRARDGGVGTLEPAVLRAWASWEVRFGIVKRPIDVGRMFATLS
jgi:putative hydroxymethylpyrimidine transport system substrate-binding protein